ncbi:MAG: LytTR family DNA-binding domain-containing protein [Bacteroidota bacterium]
MQNQFTSFTQSNNLINGVNLGLPMNVNNICLPVCYKKSMNISTKDIIHLEGHSNYTLFYFSNGKTLLVSRTMKEYIDNLDEHFVRIHKKFVINLRYLIQFDLKEEMSVLLKDGKRITISRRRKKEFLEKTRNVFGKMLG